MKVPVRTPPEKLNGALPLMESFYTLQGEGYHTGTAAYFIRLGGCPIGCTWCDVKESWDASLHPTVSEKDLVARAAEFPSRNAVITGGEPCIYDLSSLTARLKATGFNTWLETSGAWPVTGEFDWICVSPKKFASPLPEVLREADELKVIIYNRHDFSWAEKHAEQVSAGCKLYLQPEWGRAKDVLPLITDYIKINPQWRISLQTHKYMNIP